MKRGVGGALCATFSVLGLSSAHADIWITHDGVLERRDENGAIVTTISQAFGREIGAIVLRGQVDPATGNVWLLLSDDYTLPPVARVLGVTPSGGEIWQRTETGASQPGFFNLGPGFAIDAGRHGIWITRGVDPGHSSTTEAVLFDQSTGNLLATVRGLGAAGGPSVGPDGAIWLSVLRSDGGRRLLRLQGTTQELNGYKVVGATGPHHRTFVMGPQDTGIYTIDPSDGSLYFTTDTYTPATDTGDIIIVKWSAEGQELWRKGYPWEKYAHYTDIEVDPRDGSVYFTTAIYNAFIGHLSSLGVELNTTGFAEHNDSIAIDLEDSGVWVAEMPQVDDGLDLIAPMNLRKLDSSLQTLAVIPFPGPVKVLGAAPATPTALEISLDVQPQDKNNVVSLVGNTEVRVALLSNAAFDPLQVDIGTIRFGTAGAVVRSSWTRDVDHDGVADLVTTFRTGDTGIKCGDTSAPLTGETHRGVDVHGTGNLRTQCE